MNPNSPATEAAVERCINGPHRVMGTYIGGCGQRSQRHLSVWANLCMVNDKNPTYFGTAYISNVIGDGIKNAKGLEIRKVDIVRLAHSSVCSSIH